MKKSLMILFTLALPVFLIAQETDRQNEIGLVFNNFDNFGLTYKIGKTNSLWRFNTLFLNGSKIDEKTAVYTNKRSSMGAGLKIGKEFRKSLAPDFEFRYGADLSFTYSQMKTDDIDSHIERTTYKPGVNLVFGLNYVINDKIVVGAEFLPLFSYVTGTSSTSQGSGNNGDEVNTDISGFEYGLSNSSALVSLAYRF
jgi:hypothetical protein